MGFVEDHHFRFRNKFAKTAVFHHHIREKQMVVDHNHICIHRGFTR